MNTPPVERTLAAILSADVAGYSRLMEQDEIGTLRRLTACRAILDERIAAYRGRIFGSAGDSVVADFATAVYAAQCAVAVQDALAKDSAARPAGEQMRLRIRSRPQRDIVRPLPAVKSARVGSGSALPQQLADARGAALPSAGETT